MPYPAGSVFAFRGGQGDMPHASQFLQAFTWEKLAEMVPVREHRQCLLFYCKLPVGNLREQ